MRKSKTSPERMKFQRSGYSKDPTYLLPTNMDNLFWKYAVLIQRILPRPTDWPLARVSYIRTRCKYKWRMENKKNFWNQTFYPQEIPPIPSSLLLLSSFVHSYSTTIPLMHSSHCVDELYKKTHRHSSEVASRFLGCACANVECHRRFVKYIRNFAYIAKNLKMSWLL